MRRNQREGRGRRWSRRRRSTSSNNNICRSTKKMKKLSSKPPPTMMKLPVHLCVRILNFLGETQQELRNVSLVSKKMNRNCKRDDIEWTIPTLLELTKTSDYVENVEVAFLERLWEIEFYNLNQDEVEVDEEDVEAVDAAAAAEVENELHKEGLRNCSQMRVTNIDMFAGEGDLNRIDGFATQIYMLGQIKSLDASLPSQEFVAHCLPEALSLMLSDLRDINLSNMIISASILENYSRECTDLKTVTWKNIHHGCNFHINGNHLSDAENLKELYIDNSCFNVEYDSSGQYFNIFRECCTKLERVSMKNCKYTVYFKYPTQYYIDNNWPIPPIIEIVLPQNALIKFVRNAPALNWFKSDLNLNSISILQKERPEIIFC